MTIPAEIKLLAVVVVRDGELPAGSDEAAAEAAGAALVVGSGTSEAAGRLDSVSQLWRLEGSSVAPGALGTALAPVLLGGALGPVTASPAGPVVAGPPT